MELEKREVLPSLRLSLVHAMDRGSKVAVNLEVRY
jgi:hypothetical protein